MLYTKQGAPIQVVGDKLFDKTGRLVGRRDGDTVYAPDGRYAATLVDDGAGGRLVFLTRYQGLKSHAFAPMRIAATAAAPRIAAVVVGDEPFGL